MRLSIRFCCFVACILAAVTITHAGPSNNLFSDDWGDGWGSWSWNVELASVSSRHLRGTTSMRVLYNAAWSGFSLGAWNNGNGYSTTGYTHLELGVRNQVDGDDLWLFAGTPSGNEGTQLWLGNYALDGFLPSGTWTWLRIPIQDFGLGNSPTISYIAIMSSKAQSLVYFDDILFATNVRFYEGVQAIPAPSTHLWHWNASISQTSSGADYWIVVNPTSNWAGIQLQKEVTGIASYKYGGLSVLFQITQSSQELHVALVNSNNLVMDTVELTDEIYVPQALRPLVPNKWYRVLIPISDFLTNTSADIGGVAISSNIATRYYVDDVYLVQKLDFPIQDRAKEISGYRFGDLWDENHNCPGHNKYHTGTDYRTDDIPRQIHAAARGVIAEIGSHGSWGGFIILEHESSFTTSYLHTDAISGLSVGDEVQKGTPIGHAANIEGRHLHFGLRLRTHNANTQNGALPLSRTERCNFPSFPSSFLDPEQMDW